MPGRSWARPIWLPRAPRRRRWRGSGESCSASTGWGPTTTSSIWAGTRCSPPRWSRASAAILGVELSLQSLFEASTVAGLARAVEAVAAGAGGRGRCRRSCACRGTASFPLSFSQERMWFLNQLDPGTSAYNLPQAVRLRGRLDVDRCSARCFTELVRRHETLRTVFAEVDGRPVQVIQPPAPIALEVVDLRHAAAGGARGRVAAAGRARRARGRSTCRAIL